MIVQEVSWSFGSPQLNRDSGFSLCLTLWDESLQEGFLRNEEVFLIVWIVCTGIYWLQPVRTP